MPDLHLAVSPPSPVAAAVRLVSRRLGAASVHLYASDEAGRLRLVAAEGPHAESLAPLAETLVPDVPAVLDVSGIAEGVQFAVGQRAGRVALVVLGVDLAALDAAWDAGFADALALAEGLAGGAPVDDEALDAFPSGAAGHARLLHEVATHPGAFDERLQIGLRGLVEALGFEAAALGRVDGGMWTPEAAHDPNGVLPAQPVPVSTLPCSVTVRADGPVAMENAGTGFGAYLGAPVFSGGRTIGTLVAASRTPRAAPFTPDDRALAESLARWIGSAIGGHDAARRLADREAALSAFVDRAPVAMGLMAYHDAEPDDVRFVTVNAAAAALLGRAAVDVAGQSAAAVGVDARARRALAVGCRHALAGMPGEALPPVTLDLDTPAGLRTVAATLGRLDIHDADGAPVSCVSLVAEDVTEREANLRATADRRDAAEAASAEQGALFARLHHDLRTPLTTILGYADLLAPGAPDDEIEHVREVVLRSGQHLLAMLDDAVALAEAARASVSLVPVDAGETVRAAVDVCVPLAEEAGVTLGFESDAATTPVLLDVALVGRVVQTLVAEALGVPGARHVDARLGEDGTRLVFDVGVREPAERRPETARPPVALVERLVRRLGGDLAESDPGTRWTVRLPRHPAVVVEMPAVEASLAVEEPA